MRVLVAGAGGVGAACALAYVVVGASVAIVDRGALDSLGAELAIVALVTRWFRPTSPSGCGAGVVADAIEQLGGLDVMLHAVGINDRRPILDFTEDEWDQILRVNLSSLFGLAQAAGVTWWRRVSVRCWRFRVSRGCWLTTPRAVRRLEGRHQSAVARHGS